MITNHTALYPDHKLQSTWKEIKKEKEAALDIKIPRSFTLGAPALPNQSHHKEQEPNHSELTWH